MRRRTVQLAALLALALLVAPVAVPAQRPVKVHRIGLLMAHPPGTPPYLEAFYKELRDLGYVEGQNLVIERRYGEGHDERLPALAAELVQLKVEVLVASGPSPTRAAHQATKTIPIVMGNHDPVDQGLIASFARPGGNVTGWSFLSVELGGKQLEILKQLLPRLARVAVLANPATPGHALRIRHLQEAARALGLQLHALDVTSPEALDQAFAAMTRAGVEAFFVLPEPTVIDGLRGQMVARAAQHRLPAMYHWKMYAEAGGLMSYGPSLPDLSRRMAVYVDRILKGANPATMPVETPLKYEFVINLKTAEALGLTVPPHLQVFANELIR
jgi:putative ABC transport system substrate-binding protein